MATEKEILLSSEIVGICIRLNATGRCHVHASFAGHVNLLEVRLASAPFIAGQQQEIAGWGSCDRNIYLSSDDEVIYSERKTHIARIVRELTKMRGDLSAILAGGEF